MAKDCHLRKVRVEPWRLEAYYAAFYLEQEDRPDLTFATYVREAMDACYQRVTGRVLVEPEPAVEPEPEPTSEPPEDDGSEGFKLGS